MTICVHLFVHPFISSRKICVVTRAKEVKEEEEERRMNEEKKHTK